LLKKIVKRSTLQSEAYSKESRKDKAMDTLVSCDACGSVGTLDDFDWGGGECFYFCQCCGALTTVTDVR
jgi:hypothetical protein